MSERKLLLEVTYHSDDDTGMYHVGEIDFGICGTLKDYLDHYGIKGRDEIVNTLGYLIHSVYEKYEQIKLKENFNCESGKPLASA